MKLIYEKTGLPVLVGDTVFMRNGDFDPECCRVESIQAPRTLPSTGRVCLSCGGYTQEFYPSVIGATWDERPDREAAMREGYEEAGRVGTSFGEEHQS